MPLLLILERSKLDTVLQMFSDVAMICVLMALAAFLDVVVRVRILPSSISSASVMVALVLNLAMSFCFFT